MYFHLIWIKEKNWEKYELNILLQWWDENFIRDFLAHWWVVIVSLTEFKEEPKTFWNICVDLIYNETKVQLLSKWDDLWERVYFFMFVGLKPLTVNFIDNPVSDEEVKKIMDSTLIKIHEEIKKVQEEQKIKELNEKKKYEESWIKDWLKIINTNINHIEQVLKAWEWILSWSEVKKFEEYLNEMKKIRLWTNFNKMASLVLDSHILLEKAEEKIFNANDSNKFLIDKTSSITNIDVLKEYFKINKISEKAKLQPAWLKASESIINLTGLNAIFLALLGRDFSSEFSKSSFNEIFDIVINFVEYIILLMLVVISILRLVGLLGWFGNFSLYLLPAMWWLWLLVYLLNNLELKWSISRIIWFAVLVLIYRQGLTLLLNTFAL